MLRFILSLSLVTVLGWSSSAFCAERAQLPPGTLVLRLSPAALAEVQQQTFESERKINDLVLETKVTGVAKTTAKCRLESCAEEDGDKLLKVVVTGTSVTTSEGRNGPAIIRSTTTTDFVAETPLVFDRQTGFSAGETSVEAESKTQTNDIQSTQGGIAGAVVKKLAAKKVAASKEEAQRIARDLAITRIRQEVQAELERRLARVNESYRRMSPVLTALRKDASEAVMIAASESGVTVLLAKREFARDAAAVQLPALEASAELWWPAEGAAKPKLELAPSDRFAVSVKTPPKLPAPILDRYEHWWIVRLPVVQAQTSR